MSLNMTLGRMIYCFIIRFVTQSYSVIVELNELTSLDHGQAVKMDVNIGDYDCEEAIHNITDTCDY